MNKINNLLYILCNKNNNVGFVLFMKTKIRYLRQEMGISQKDLASKVGVTRQTVNALENGRYNPSLLVAYQITKILKQDHIEDVFFLDEE